MACDCPAELDIDSIVAKMSGSHTYSPLAEIPGMVSTRDKSESLQD
jgi:hypothetical protein